MPIDVEKALSASIPGVGFSWAEKDVILYNLAVGAGDPPELERELSYAYEGDLQVLPGFGTIPPFSMMMGLTEIEGVDINLAQILHGDQELTVHRRIPTSGMVTQEGRVIDVFDKGKGALVVVEVVSTMEGEPLFTNRSGVFVRGEGGFGGDSGPGRRYQPPDREPDKVVESPTLPQQALLYRQVSGDRNPLHADPGFAAFAGFERPILHGLCTYGIVAKSVVDHVLEGDASRFDAFSARFSGHVFPGETLVTSIWTTDDGIVVGTTTAERGLPVLSNALVTASF